MRDLFDDFMDELRRREAEARGEDPDAVAPRRRRPEGNRLDPDGDGGDDGDGNDDDRSGSDDDGTDGPNAADNADSRDGGDREPPRPIRRTSRGGPHDGGGFRYRLRRAGRSIVIALVALAVIALFALFAFGLEIWTDALWFQSVGFSDVYWTRIAAQLGLFLFGLVLALVVLLGNLWLAGRLTPPPVPGGGTFRNLVDRLNEAAQSAESARMGGARRYDPGRDRRPAAVTFSAEDLPDLGPIATWVLAGLAILFALGVAGSLATAWETVLLWQNRVPYSETASITDPIFGRDISFFLFELPFLRLVQALFNGLVLTGLLIALVRYLVGAMRGASVFTTQVRVHLAVLGALFLLSVAFGYQLDKMELVYSTRGSVETSALDTVGVSFTDQHAQFLAYDVLTVLSGLAAAFLVGAAFTRMVWPLGLTLAVWFVASIVIGRVYPEAIQYFTVRPNQFAQEEPYIGNNIAMTRLAYGLDQWEDDRPFQGEEVLTEEAIENDEDTFRNARLWDYRPLHDAFGQLQALRPYYGFTDIDTDRYQIDGVQRQVMLGARELDPSALGGGWVNERVNFTHGIGVVMAPVNEVTGEGQPRLIIRNLPPVSSEGVPEIAEPRIYFGERPSNYVVTGARDDEFDYPTGTSDQSGTSTRWSGSTGIKLDTTLMRLLFALRFRDLNLLISDQVTNESQLLFDRAIAQRLPKIAPFLRYDKDPYMVIDQATGGLIWVQDAYTVSDRFPHANWFDPGTLPETNLGGGAFNYIRNSVKITIDAYDGTTTFYAADQSDPIIRTYSKVFPTLFRPIDELPESLRGHLRFPEELFNVQTRVFGRYHVTSPQQFFRSDDLWTVPEGQTTEQTLPSEAYYVVMRMPGEDHAEFLLLQPMVPRNRLNMIAWVAARMDPGVYGTTRVYRFPADTTVFGPAQIESRIDADGAISEQLTLWSQAGSTVVRGNLIVIPVGDSIVYLQPFYLQSTAAALPEFQRIVVASPREVVWSRTLGDGLRLLLAAEQGGETPAPGPGESPGPSPGPSPTPTETPGGSPGAGPELPGTVDELIDFANLHYELAQAALRAGDLATYGEEIELVGAALEELDRLGASPAP
jgi:uncharacterized membrane protein (UPF0182 family)